MSRSNRSLKGPFLVALVITIMVLVSSCYCPKNLSIPQICKLITVGPAAPITSSNTTQVFEDPGTIIVFHGFACAESRKSGQQDVIRVAQSLDLPAYATSATVLLNGWHLQYLESDHHVAAVGTALGNIRREANTLKWQAAGVITDDNFDDPYSWCYFFTAVGWDPTKISAAVDDKDGCDRNDADVNFFAADNNTDATSTALSSFSSFLKNPAFESSNTVAILPRGFGFEWEQDCGVVDHHLLQMGYDLDHSATFIQGGKKYWKSVQEVVALPQPSPTQSPSGILSQADTGFVSWDTYTIFKDNDTRRHYDFSEIVSGMAGKDVGVLEPPFSILPQEGQGGSGVQIGGAPLRTEEFAIDNIPFAYAIPMLTGFEIHYTTDDQHVKEIGIWIDEFHFLDPTDPPGRLRYKVSTTLHDDDTLPTNDYHHKVTVLGLRPVTPVSTRPNGPDLVPFSPPGKGSVAGNGPAAFCRIEQGKVLRVTVKNQGSENAGISKTTVAFGSRSFTLDTPPIPAGGSVDLLFKVPANCFKPDCSFKIKVDSSNQVNEGPNEGNNTVNVGCTG